MAAIVAQCAAGLGFSAAEHLRYNVLRSEKRSWDIYGTERSYTRSGMHDACVSSCLIPYYSQSPMSSVNFARREFCILNGAAMAVSTTRALEASAQENIASNEQLTIDTTITDRVYLDLSLCPNASRSDRTLGNASRICTDGEPLGRIVIGLYGRQVPVSVKIFIAMCTGQAGASYAGTIIHRILPGEYFQAGRQGSKERGEISGPLKLDRNLETISAKAYTLNHNRPGTVSLCLSENDDDDQLKLSPDYHNVQFLITTGPGPAPKLDNGNIVIGTVLQGMDVVTALTAVPTYKPGLRIRQFNDFAEFLGDDRAANARTFWNRPLKSVVISRCGELPMGVPFFPPGLP